MAVARTKLLTYATNYNDADFKDYTDLTCFCTTPISDHSTVFVSVSVLSFARSV